MNFCNDYPPKWIMMNVTKTQHELKHMDPWNFWSDPTWWLSHPMVAMVILSEHPTKNHPNGMTLWERWAGELLKTHNIDLELDTVKLDLRKKTHIFFFQSSCVLHSFLGISLSLYIRRHQNTTTGHCGMTWASETLRSTVSKQDEEKVGAFCKW